MQTNALKKKNIIILVESTDNDRPAWWYVKCHSRILAEKLKGVCRLGTLDIIPLEEYGDIVLSGWGETPPTDAIEYMKKYYS